LYRTSAKFDLIEGPRVVPNRQRGTSDSVSAGRLLDRFLSRRRVWRFRCLLGRRRGGDCGISRLGHRDSRDNPRKGDRADAEILARLARLDPNLLSPIHHRLPSCSSHSFSKKVEPSIPEPLRPALLPLLETTATLTRQIRAYDRQIETLCETQYPETRSLQQVSGVGALTALTFVLTLEDPARFAKSREVGPALGLVPRRDQSGDRDPQLPITKTGNAFLRRLLVGSAHYVLGPFGPDCLCPARVRVTTRSRKTVSEIAAPTCPAGIPVGERTPTGTGLTEEPNKSADGSEAKGCWLRKIREDGRHVDP